MSKPYVFISYSTKDQEYADKVSAVLSENGINFWIASNDIHGGESFANEITNAINDCKAFIFLLSKNSDSSPHCGNELSLAFSGRKHIIPFRLHDFNLSKANTYFLQQAQWIDAFVDESVAFSELIKKVNLAFEDKEDKSKTVLIRSNDEKKIENFIKRAYLSLEDKSFDDANKFAEEVLNIDMEYAEAYFIKFLCDLKVDNEFKLLEFDYKDKKIEEMINFKNAKRFAKGEFLIKIQDFVKKRQTVFEFLDIQLRIKNRFNLNKIKQRIEKITYYTPAQELYEKIDKIWEDREKENEEKVMEQKKARELYCQKKLSVVKKKIKSPFDLQMIKNTLTKIKDYEPALELLNNIESIWKDIELKAEVQIKQET